MPKKKKQIRTLVLCTGGLSEIGGGHDCPSALSEPGIGLHCACVCDGKPCCYCGFRLDGPKKDNEKRKAKFQKGRKKFDARVSALPQEFQERMNRFMKRKDWGWEFGDYELFVCEDAVKLARSCNMSLKELKKFYKLGHDEQMKSAEKAGVEVAAHSGNTYAMAVNLAWLYIDRPSYVVKMHGAMCPLVGCQGYGCWTATHKRGKK